MKRLMLVLMVALVGGFSKSVAQNTLVATLTHGDEIKMFYGVNAFAQAHAAAENGDVINLSGGTFNATDITKGITVRGTGTNVTFPTWIKGVFSVNVPSTISEKFMIEGCWFNGNISISGTTTDAYFLKNIFASAGDWLYLRDNTKHTTFINCRIWSFFCYQNNSSVSCINSILFQVNPTNSSDSSSADFINCVIRPKGDYPAEIIRNARLVNCILYNNSSTRFNSLPATSSAYNCIAVGPGNASVFNNLSVNQNCTSADTDIFKDGNYQNDLTDEAKEIFYGNDGTPVGMYGGLFPYNLIPSYPQITKMNVANKTTADGKLSVEIEVCAAE